MKTEQNQINIAVLVSGGGTNLQALINAERKGLLHSGKIALVISNRADAYALKRAEKAGIPTALAVKGACGGQAGMEARICALLSDYSVDLIILAGFMSILSGDFTSRFDHRILNVHPSLIPSFCGTGFYGLKVHEAALSRGVKVTGATVRILRRRILRSAGSSGGTGKRGQGHGRYGALCQRDSRRWGNHSAKSRPGLRRRHPRDVAETRDAACGVEDSPRRGRTGFRKNSEGERKS